MESEDSIVKILYSHIIDTDRQVHPVDSERVTIGRGIHNDLTLKSPFVANEAAVLEKHGAGWLLTALQMNEIRAGDTTLCAGDTYLITTDEIVVINPFTLSLDLPKNAVVSQQDRLQQLDLDTSQWVQDIHVALLPRISANSSTRGGDTVSDDELEAIERDIDLLARDQRDLSSETDPILLHVAGLSVKERLIETLSTSKQARTPSELIDAENTWFRSVLDVPERESELNATVTYVNQQLAIDDVDDVSGCLEKIDEEFWKLWSRIARSVHADLKEYAILKFLRKQIKDIVFGYGPLEDLIRLPTVSEIMVVSSDQIFVEKSGVLQDSGRRFVSDDVTLSIIERIVSKVGRRIDKSSPLVDARLSDGSRVNAIVPPLAVSGPALTIRKFPAKKLMIDDLIEKRALTQTVAKFLRAAVLNHRNILISGGTGTGKTTMLNCLSDYIPDNERIVTVEDTAELQLHKSHVVRLETKESNIEGQGEYAIRDLVKNALRMRPDRIVVGECRGAEALDMLQAMNTGHDGSLTTIHANSAQDVILRLEVLVQMAANLPVQSIHRQIESAIDLIVQLHRMRDGRRCITQISEVVGIDPHTETIKIRDLFFLQQQESQAGVLLATGCLPTFMDELMEQELLDLSGFFHVDGNEEHAVA